MLKSPLIHLNLNHWWTKPAFANSVIFLSTHANHFIDNRLADQEIFSRINRNSSSCFVCFGIEHKRQGIYLVAAKKMAAGFPDAVERKGKSADGIKCILPTLQISMESKVS
jgi:hypothetical protein